MIQFKYLEEYVYIQCMIHSALCVWKSALKPKSFASIPEYLDRVHKCSLFAPCFIPYSFEAGNVYIVDPVDLALNTWCPLSDDFAFTIDALSNEFSSISDKQTSRLGRWGPVRLAFFTSNANRKADGPADALEVIERFSH